MKITTLILSVLTLLLTGCNKKYSLQNHFYSNQDTLVIKTIKEQGYGLFSGGGGTVLFQDTTEFYKYQVIFPQNISDIKLAYQIIDFKRFNYDSFNDKASWNDPITIENSICLLKGKRGTDDIFIIDENNNKDLSDDSIRVVQDYERNKNHKPIKIKYNIETGNKISSDSSWVIMQPASENELYFFVSHHLRSEFSIENQTYEVGLVNFRSGFCFDEPKIALIGQNGVKKDTLLDMEFIYKDEFLKIKDSYYRLDTVSNDGKYITLIKEYDFNSKIGTQVGMIAPSFVCKTIDADSINYNHYKGRYLLITNVSACWSPISSYQCFKELSDLYKDKLGIICLDKSPVLANNINQLKLTGHFINVYENPDLNKYRLDFCSRTCYLINPTGRIIDKFEIFDWKESLDKHFN